MIAPLFPAALTGGRPRTTCLRQVMNAFFYLLQTGCQWRMLPRDFRRAPPSKTTSEPGSQAGSGRTSTTCYRRTGSWKAATRAPRRRSSTANSQSAKAGGSPQNGYNAGKRVKGRKRHLVTDTLGLMLRVEVHSASVQDRDGAALVLDRITRRFPFLKRIFADAGYPGPLVAAAPVPS
jgi:putative transposase